MADAGSTDMGLVVTNEDSGVSTVIVGPDASTNALAPDINAPSNKDPNWGRVATGTYYAYDTSQAPAAPPSQHLGIPQDRYKPTSVGKKKSSFFLTREDLAERGEEYHEDEPEDA
uniref:Uncharacterized protein n=1 Tax=Eutreptiella gymnastica TaxID=73025 RepID=A0A7S4GL49_9EUGL